MLKPQNSFDEFAQTLLEASKGVGELIAERMPPALDRKVGILSLGDILLIIAVIAGTLLLRWLVVWLLDKLFEFFLKRHSNEIGKRWVDIILRVTSYVILMSGLYLLAAGIHYPRKPFDFELTIWRVVTCILLIFAGMVGFKLVMIIMHYLTLRQSSHDHGLIDRRMMPLIRDVVKVLVIIVVAIMIVQVWGYSAATILAGVGLGGLALAFAAQDSIANVFGSMVIYTDRPYKVGDWVIISGIEGTIEEIGIRSTRVRTFDNTLVSIPNKNIANENIQNFEAVKLRRIRFILGVKYGTPPEKLMEVRERIYGIIKAHPEIHKKNVTVRFWEFGASSLDFLVLCFTPFTKLDGFSRVQEELLISILKALREIGVEIAFPSQSIYLEKDNDLVAPD